MNSNDVPNIVKHTPRPPLVLKAGAALVATLSSSLTTYNANFFKNLRTLYIFSVKLL